MRYWPRSGSLPPWPTAQELRAAHPLRDRACWLEMIALHRAGRSPDALERFAEHAKRLDEELGIQPGAELRELQVAILRHEPALAAWPRPASWTGAAQLHTPELDAAPAEARPPASSLVGRARETRVLDEVLAAGSARWLVLTGPAGIGKTRLAEELVARGRTKAVWARCSEEDGAPAWWPIRQLVRSLGDDPDTLLVPPANADADEARFAAYERVAALLEANQPLIIVIDDIQWADATSARCLAHLVGALRETCRSWSRSPSATASRPRRSRLCWPRWPAATGTGSSRSARSRRTPSASSRGRSPASR